MGKRVVVGDKFGKLEVIKTWVAPDGRKQTICECKCECGTASFITRAANLRSNRQYHCGCVRLLRGKDSPKWKGYGNISQRLWKAIIDRAKIKNLEFNLTIEYVWDLYLQQDGKCSLTGIELYLPMTCHEKYTASLDRIDSNFGYIIGNVQWVHNVINIMKWNFPEEIFINWCKVIANNNSIKE